MRALDTSRTKPPEINPGTAFSGKLVCVYEDLLFKNTDFGSCNKGILYSSQITSKIKSDVPILFPKMYRIF